MTRIHISGIVLLILVYIIGARYPQLAQKIGVA